MLGCRRRGARLAEPQKQGVRNAANMESNLENDSTVDGRSEDAKWMTDGYQTDTRCTVTVNDRFAVTVSTFR